MLDQLVTPGSLPCGRLSVELYSSCHRVFPAACVNQGSLLSYSAFAPGCPRSTWQCPGDVLARLSQTQASQLNSRHTTPYQIWHRSFHHVIAVPDRNSSKSSISIRLVRPALLPLAAPGKGPLCTANSIAHLQSIHVGRTSVSGSVMCRCMQTVFLAYKRRSLRLPIVVPAAAQETNSGHTYQTLRTRALPQARQGL